MSNEQYINDMTGATTLATSLTDTTGTSVVVTSATPFPSVAQFRIRIDSEIMLVTAVSGTTLTVTRGAEGSTAATHTSGTFVCPIITAASVQAANIAFSKFPASPGFTLPILSNFSWVNQGSATATQGSFGIALSDNHSGGDALRMLEISAPATPYTITAYIQSNAQMVGTLYWGLYWRNAGGSTPVTFALVTNTGATPNTLAINTAKWLSYASWNANYTTGNGYFNLIPGEYWLRITDNGTNRKGYISRDGANFIEMHSTTHSDYITPDKVGVVFSSNNSTYPLNLNLLSFKVS